MAFLAAASNTTDADAMRAKTRGSARHATGRVMADAPAQRLFLRTSPARATGMGRLWKRAANAEKSSIPAISTRSAISHFGTGLFRGHARSATQRIWWKKRTGTGQKLPARSRAAGLCSERRLTADRQYISAASRFLHQASIFSMALPNSAAIQKIPILCCRSFFKLGGQCLVKADFFAVAPNKQIQVSALL
jgi:hypothetical protein